MTTPDDAMDKRQQGRSVRPVADGGDYDIDARPPSAGTSGAPCRTVVLRSPNGRIVPTRWLLPGQQLTVGRTDAADNCVPCDPHMSSVHFSLACHARGAIVRDLNSANGTFVNGQLSGYAELRDGDQITAGLTVFTVRFMR